ncbi:hypothetical protein Dsin_001062 [Dipteronia sinensis]|uniref:Biotin carboxyl carrier protein of acetyl-CoA carboxylase n=1 Tax=Dipteronia sinensis TaxID=43782 RepID=A0AAE0B357_9ROSI|nr:hypothetical protein Dsin_001062 [Dipteronia sinensis]
MASSSSLSTVTAASSISAKTTSSLLHNYHSATVSFRFSSKPKPPRICTKGLQPSWRISTVVKAQLNEVRSFQWFSFVDMFSNFRSSLDMLFGSSVAFKVAVDGSSNVASTSPNKSELPPVEAKDAKTLNEPSSATEESVSEFISQVSSLVKLVDSRDIVELQLKQLDCELIIRKKEALLKPPSPPPPMFMMHPPSPQSVMPPASPAPAPAPTTSAPAPSLAASPPPSTPAGKSAKSSLPPLKCPMAGTFYRSPGPGESPFVKVGDKVQKGQVVCIIEAMKLMNEIEADQSGTIIDIIAEDGKPVSVDTPLFVIEP